VLVWEQWFIYETAIYRKYVLVWVSNSFTVLRLTGHMGWCGTSDLFTEMLFTGILCWCGSSGLLT
jgi:hypothetical protein